MSTAVAVVGAGGRMGRMLVDTILRDEEAYLVAAADRGEQLLGQDAGELAGIGALGVEISANLEAVVAAADVVIDFSLPQATVEVAAACRQHKCPLVLGTTGLAAGQSEAVAELSQHNAVVHAANYSTGITLLTALVEQAAQAVGAQSDIEIIEAHHRHKVDAPSGTALRLGEAVAKELGRDLGQCAVYGREGHTGERDSKTIGFETIRAGDIVGEHTVMFAGQGERIELTHKASSRSTFAVGALRAAHWVIGQPAGLYDMRDVLGLSC
ncbi:4-hydroxy-tetrahydrodipicolinate reductase [Halorhodospira halochloris]|uniref:4-hydroxy-tetrahydrodipicolinate reductase n=1 Tax=Halorhodospira halochloris TaxID=1052 RepID=A0A0X8X8D0_HALHR|nr:4-hydroxy-tetrahydrodipicolinate reductase [Halorhodospira halochloris]MBK1651170.1 4-hydroxy-tetrahydrodipicolinate reductase [Halorhodospira halochloris]MCG5531066.1 4-hydroxy-tetrahydrodipicolinate reductase [Halorhodospira halochloris]BAU57441.1 4-hydroxy-tetrahydrodipicolinate reductase [Halorhodospira halochloris]